MFSVVVFLVGLFDFFGCFMLGRGGDDECVRGMIEDASWRIYKYFELVSCLVRLL